jgi:hypothetical protein
MQREVSFHKHKDLLHEHNGTTGAVVAPLLAAAATLLLV